MDSYDERAKPQPGAQESGAPQSTEAAAGLRQPLSSPGLHSDTAHDARDTPAAHAETDTPAARGRHDPHDSQEVPGSTQEPASGTTISGATTSGATTSGTTTSGTTTPAATTSGGAPASASPTLPGQASAPDASAPDTPALPPPPPDQSTARATAQATRSPQPPTAPADSSDTPPPGTGIGALSFRYQVVAAVALAAIAVGVCTHLLLVFLSVAPANTMTKTHGQVVDDWVFPEFEQNWKLFAPNPLQQNIAVEARAEVRTASGNVRTTRWYNFSAMDGAAIDGNPAPSHTQQNELRRAWDFFVSSHDNQNRPTGTRGKLSEDYLRRIAVLRFSRLGVGGDAATDSVVQNIQIRSKTTNVKPPVWGGLGPVSTQPFYRTLAWWPVTPDDLPLHDASAAAHPKHTKTEAGPR